MPTKRQRVTRSLVARITPEAIAAQPTHNRRDAEKQFYLDFFGDAERVACSEGEQQAALALMIQKNGLQCVDALHLASAIAGRATEFVTAEGTTKPLVTIDVPDLAIRTVRVAG